MQGGKCWFWVNPTPVKPFPGKTLRIGGNMLR